MKKIVVLAHHNNNFLKYVFMLPSLLNIIILQVFEICRRVLCGDGLEEEDKPKKTIQEELRADSLPGIFAPADRHQRAAALDVLFPKLVGGVLEPPTPAEPPHIALVFGAWQRRAVLAAAASPAAAPKVLKHGFFADTDVDNPRLLAKTLDQYELRPEKEYNETIVLMVAVGFAEPALADPTAETGAPEALLRLGPLHISCDAVVGAEECLRFFPPGYTVPEKVHKPKPKKKKKKRAETKEDTVEEVNGTTEAAQEPDVSLGDAGDGGDGGDAGGEGGDEEGPEGDEDDPDDTADKATSPPPQTPH